MTAEQRTHEINRMIREQGAARELLDVLMPTCTKLCQVTTVHGRLAQLWHDDALTEECLLRLEETA